ncbi:MAG: RNA-binding transcriptional accessory protein [Bacteroidetes bacterium CG2_30_32_10]|nr:MAG: RNA-binding transcriptional accessory protein [Bacteroidetes bacterium CG2_30_32_10]
MKSHQEIIATELGISVGQVERTILLLNGGATVPFIARYRKEMTGSLDEVAITNIRDRNTQLIELDKRRESIINSIQEQGKLSKELEKQINNVATISELEDIYLPYKPKRKTRATMAIAKGLEPLALLIMEQRLSEIETKAESFIDEEKGVSSIEDAIAGARDIIAEWVNESQTARSQIRKLYSYEANIKSKVVKGKEKEGEKYENYFECEELLKKSPSHRVLAMFRGENDGFLKLTIAPPEEKAIALLEKTFIKGNNAASQEVQKAIKDSYKRLLSPSIETEIRQVHKLKADEEAIRVFVENIRQLLLSPPLGEKNVLAIDPGYRTGCKVVCIDKNGKLLHNETIFPHPPESQVKQAANKINNLINAYKIEAIAIGNGTAGRETERFIKSIRFEKDVMALMVNESGASVYSASAVAREEFPEYDITVRGAVSIGRRLMDPLAELVKIDPKSIGVGQYQHDVDQKLLQHSLDDAVMSCVNAVGVEVNTASKQLLTYVSGLGPTLAQNLVDYRNKNGAFKSREELKKVPRFGDKAFEQAAGFLRIRDSINLLDRSAVHPESYNIVKTMSKDLSCSIEELIKKEELRKQINIHKYVTETIGLPTLQDIVSELAKPGRDPRVKFDFFEFDKNVHSMKDLEIGMVLPGIVTNITAFGAFVDIGVHQDGLIHISQMADKFISNPNEVVKLNQKVKVRVVEVDTERKRIQLSMKDVK